MALESQSSASSSVMHEQRASKYRGPKPVQQLDPIIWSCPGSFQLRPSLQGSTNMDLIVRPSLITYRRGPAVAALPFFGQLCSDRTLWNRLLWLGLPFWNCRPGFGQLHLWSCFDVRHRFGFCSLLRSHATLRSRASRHGSRGNRLSNGASSTASSLASSLWSVGQTRRLVNRAKVGIPLGFANILCRGEVFVPHNLPSTNTLQIQNASRRGCRFGQHVCQLSVRVHPSSLDSRCPHLLSRC